MKTRKKRGKTGKKWARYGLKRVEESGSPGEASMRGLSLEFRTNGASVLIASACGAHGARVSNHPTNHQLRRLTGHDKTASLDRSKPDPEGAKKQGGMRAHLRGLDGADLAQPELP